MRKRAVLLAVVVLSCQCLAQGPVSQDAAAVYRTFLASYDNGSHTTLNIADRTVAFSPSFNNDSAASCLKDIHLQTVPGTQTHLLDTSILPNGLKAGLIDKENAKQTLKDPGDAIRRGEPVDEAVERGFAAGVLTLSEIVFNDDHTEAVLSFSFHCGRLCGNGGAMLFKVQHGHWSQGKQVCGGRVS